MLDKPYGLYYCLCIQDGAEVANLAAMSAAIKAVLDIGRNSQMRETG
jgi:hypothetical protein